MVLDTAEQNWLVALKKHIEVKKEKNYIQDTNPHSQVKEEEVEKEESDLLAAFYPSPIEKKPDQDESEEKEELHFFCCKHPGRPVECLPHADWHIRRKATSICSYYKNF